MADHVGHDGKIRVGLVGLGNMGAAIAERLTKDPGVDLHVCDINARASARAVSLGATAHLTPREVANAADVVCTCLPTIESVRDTLLGPNGIGKGARVKYHVELSTIGPDAITGFSPALAALGLGVLDAPVSGGPLRALEGTLTIIISGPPDVRRAVEPTLKAISSQVVLVGDTVGHAQGMKVINNLLAACNMATAVEGLTLGVKWGLDPEKLIEVVNQSSGKSVGLDFRRSSAILARRFEVNPALGMIAVIEKDLAIAFDMANGLGIPLSAMPACAGAGHLWREAVNQGLAKQNVAAIIKVVERAVGIEVHGAGLESASSDIRS
jgi:3-hydroxyisobutyrate dehydrogenase